MLRRIYNHVAPGRRAGAAGLTEMTATFNSVPMAPLPDGPFAGRTVKPFTEMEPNVTTPYNPMEYNDYLVLDSWSIGPDTVILRLAFPDSAKETLHQYAEHLHCPSHVSVNALIPGTGEVKHTYTIVSRPDAAGYFDLLIKGYDPSLLPDPTKKGGKALLLKDGTGGGVAWHTVHKRPGEYVEVKLKKKKSHIGGQSTGGYRANRWREVGMVGSGTGVAPFIQIIRTAVPDPTDNTRFSVVMCQRTEADLLLKDELDTWARDYSDQVRVTYTLTRPSDTWKGRIGRVDAGLLRETMPQPADDIIVLVCGTDEFRDAMAGPRNEEEPVIGKPGKTKTGSGPVLGVLSEVGNYAESMCYKF